MCEREFCVLCANEHKSNLKSRMMADAPSSLKSRVSRCRFVAHLEHMFPFCDDVGLLTQKGCSLYPSSTHVSHTCTLLLPTSSDNTHANAYLTHTHARTRTGAEIAFALDLCAPETRRGSSTSGTAYRTRTACTARGVGGVRTPPRRQRRPIQTQRRRQGLQVAPPLNM